MKKFKVKISGIAPFLMARHPLPNEQEEILNRHVGTGKGAKKVKDLSDEEQYEMHAYKTKEGKYFLASVMIEASMTKAAASFKMEGKKTFKDCMKGGIIVDPDEIVFKQQNFVADGRWAVNASSRGSVWVVRPRIDKWDAEFSLTLLQDERVSEDILKQILEYAGLYVGVGAWRPKFGRFEVKSFEEIE